MEFWLPPQLGSNVNEKLKNSPKSENVIFFSKVSISTLVQPQGNLELNLKEMHLIGSEITVTQIVNGDAGRRTTGG